VGEGGERGKVAADELLAGVSKDAFGDQEEVAREGEELWPSLTNAEKLSIVTTYLRAEYNYCVHCGHQYADPEELARDCPGETEEDH